MGRISLSAAALAALLAAAPADAQPAGRQSRVPTTGGVPDTATAGDVAGTTLDAGGRALPDTRVQIRNLRSGHIEQSTTSDRLGQFIFRRLPPGTYVVEMTLTDGSVVAISDPVTVVDGQVARTVVQMAARNRSFAWWLGSTTTLALSQAAGLGVLAVNPGQPVTPQ